MKEQQQQSKPLNTLVSEVVIENVGPKQSACVSLRRHLGRWLSLLVLAQVLIRMMSMILRYESSTLILCKELSSTIFPL